MELDQPNSTRADKNLVASDSDWTPSLQWPTIFLCLVGVLSSTLLLKVVSIQYLELIYAFQMFSLLLAFVHRGYRATWFRPLFRLGLLFGLICLIAFSLGMASLRYDFYLPTDLNILRYPAVIAASRTLELLVNSFMMVYLADEFRKCPAKARFTLRLYFWSGLVSAVYSLVSYPISFVTSLEFGAYSDSHRLRGFFNEGGPYGMYLVTVFLAGFVLYRLGWEPKRRLWLCFGLLSVVFIMAASKAGALAVLTMLFLIGVTAGSTTQKALIFGLMAIIFVVFSSTLDLGVILRLSAESSQSYEKQSHLHERDPNVVYGRVAGAFIVPRMIAAHPLTGIGWGNYGLVRNDPQYRGASAWADASDDPGLGMLGLAAELGLPLLSFILIGLAVPYIYLRRIKAPLYLTNLALAQPIIHLFGAQLNLTYGWIISAIAMGLAFSMATPDQLAPLLGRKQRPAEDSTVRSKNVAIEGSI